MIDYQVGSPVVCIDARTDERATITLTGGNGPKKGKIYKVTWIGNCVGKEGHVLAMRYEGMTAPKGGYAADRFRKLPPAEPEFISLIRSLGVPKRVREDA